VLTANIPGYSVTTEAFLIRRRPGISVTLTTQHVCTIDQITVAYNHRAWVEATPGFFSFPAFFLLVILVVQYDQILLSNQSSAPNTYRKTVQSAMNL
jgi:hypothetical protein